MDDREKDMRTTQTHMFLETTARRKLAWMAVPAIVALLMTAVPRSSLAATADPKTFSSPDEASRALLQAVQNHDEEALQAILGAGKEITSSGVDEDDALEREQFSQKYQEMHRLVREPDGTTVLYIGAENWPFPIPLTSNNGRWSFDAQTGTQEILFRRIGENEAAALDVCRQYAQSLAGDGAESADPDAPPPAQNEPFRGYYFRIVGGTKPRDVVCVAHPVGYRSSGVMTFIVTRDGVVYAKDLGPTTPTVAQAIDERKPASRWGVVK
jgi:hypothetical protein